MRELEAEIGDHGRPEPLGLFDRDAVEFVVIRTLEPSHETRDVCALDELGTRRPDDVVHIDSLGRMRACLFTPENRKWWTLLAVAFGLFMIMLDNTVVNVALPSIARDL